MNPQNNSNQNFDPNNPMNQMGFGGSSEMSYENYDEEALKRANAPKDDSAVPINVINAVNANGIVSGRKVVDESWQKMAICAFVIAAGCLIGVVVSVIIANSLNGKISELNSKNMSLTSSLNMYYDTLGVKDNSEVMTLITSPEILSGADMTKIDELLKGKYGAGYVIDFADTTINNVQRGAYYKTVSLGIAQETGTARAILYAKNADGEWKLASFDKMAEDPCKDATEEDRAALHTIGLCELAKPEAENAEEQE